MTVEMSQFAPSPATTERRARPARYCTMHSESFKRSEAPFLRPFLARTARKTSFLIFGETSRQLGQFENKSERYLPRTTSKEN